MGINITSRMIKVLNDSISVMQTWAKVGGHDTDRIDYPFLRSIAEEVKFAWKWLSMRAKNGCEDSIFAMESFGRYSAMCPDSGSPYSVYLDEVAPFGADYVSPRMYCHHASFRSPQSVWVNEDRTGLVKNF